MSAANADSVGQLVAEQLARVSEPTVAARIRSLLVSPYSVAREFDYGSPKISYPCWTVLEHRPSNTGIAYCEQGFGPRCPWGLVSLSGRCMSIGMDCGWFSTLEAAFRDSMAWDEGSSG